MSDETAPPGSGAKTGPAATKGKAEPRAERRARGFARAGGLIETQLRTVAARRGYVEARLRALWPEIAGPELAAITRPVKLTTSRGPAGGLLTLAVSGAHAPQIQMTVPLLVDRVNAALGPGTVGRIQLTHGTTGPVSAPKPVPAAPPPPHPDLAPIREGLSTIGDDNLRRALETLAQNVLSRSLKSQ